MGAKAWSMEKAGKVAIAIGRKRVLASWNDAAELLAELQILFDERCLNDPEAISYDLEDGREG